MSRTLPKLEPMFVLSAFSRFFTENNLEKASFKRIASRKIELWSRRVRENSNSAVRSAVLRLRLQSLKNPIWEKMAIHV